MKNMKLGTLLLLSLVFYNSEASVVRLSNLFLGLKGFGKDTTGGLGGKIYVVKNQNDDLDPGSLRYGIERQDGPTWIIFDQTVFPKNKKVLITLKGPLVLRSNTTIDGRGSHVVLQKNYNWKDAVWSRVHDEVYECRKVSKPSTDMGAILKLNSVQNIIITHLDFKQRIDGEKPKYESMDTECFNDVITIYNTEEDQKVKHFNNIWINHSSFDACGDECISVVRSSKVKRAHVTISNNLFKNSYKGMIIGGRNDFDFMIAASIYGNFFSNNKERMPRVEKAIAHVFNNAFKDWQVYGTGANAKTRVLVENNVYYSTGALPRLHPWRKFSGDDSALWVKSNILLNTVSKTLDMANVGFPKDKKEGGPWYYDSSLSYSLNEINPISSYKDISSNAGWKDEVNDIKP